MSTMSGRANELADRMSLDVGAEGGAFPFCEDEDANLTGYGHQDRATFAAEVMRFDIEVGGFDAAELPDWTDDIAHRWVTIDGEMLTICPEGTPGAISVTTLWGAR